MEHFVAILSHEMENNRNNVLRLFGRGSLFPPSWRSQNSFPSNTASATESASEPVIFEIE